MCIQCSHNSLTVTRQLINIHQHHEIKVNTTSCNCKEVVDIHLHNSLATSRTLLTPRHSAFTQLQRGWLTFIHSWSYNFFAATYTLAYTRNSLIIQLSYNCNTVAIPFAKKLINIHYSIHTTLLQLANMRNSACIQCSHSNHTTLLQSQDSWLTFINITKYSSHTSSVATLSYNHLTIATQLQHHLQRGWLTFTNTMKSKWNTITLQIITKWKLKVKIYFCFVFFFTFIHTGICGRVFLIISSTRFTMCIGIGGRWSGCRWWNTSLTPWRSLQKL